MRQLQSNYVREIFDILHKMPEAAMLEYRTAEFLANEIRAMGYDVREGVGGTGVIAVLESGNPGPVIGLRADMDALTYQIGDKLECRHTCGHDAHAAMVLASAKMVAERGIKNGKIVVLFQPGEEPILGALAMIGSGQIDKLGIDELYGIHLRPIGEMAVGTVTPALYHSASGRLRIQILLGRTDCRMNAVEAMVLAVHAVNMIHMNPTIHYSIKATHMNVRPLTSTQTPERVELIIDLKHQDTEMYEQMEKKAIHAIESATASIGAKAVAERINYVPGAVYSKEAIRTARQAIIDVLGEAACLPSVETTGGDDFHYFVRHLGCKATYLGLGADASPGLHHQDMTFNADCLDYGVRILTDIVNKRVGDSG